MLSHISWLQFFSGIGTIVIIYYLYVLVKYYPHKIKGIFASKNRKAEMNPSFMQTEDGHDPAETHDEEHDEFREIEELVSNLQELIREGSANITEVGDFQKEISLVLHQARDLRKSPYRPSINELIKSECSKYGTFALSEKEIDALWD